MKTFACIVGLLGAAMTGPTTVASAPTTSDDVPAFEALVQQPPPLDPARRGRHPRLFFDAAGLAQLQARARQAPDAWRTFRQRAAGLRRRPPAPPAQGRGQHYAVGLALAEPAFAYAIARDPRDLAQARRWIAAALAYEPWGYAYNKPDQDIPAAFLLYGLTFAYDLLAPDLAPAERDAIRRKIAGKAARLADAYRWKPGRRYTFSQNHTFINAAAFGLAGMALAGEHPDAERWVSLARAIVDRTVRTYSPDGYYYEGYHYFEFSVPWIVHILDAFEANTPERWYERLRLDLAKLYVAHSLLPDGNVFDLGDTGTGAAGRLARNRDVLGAHPLLYRVAARYRDPLSATVADWATSLGLPDREPVWTFIWQAALAQEAGIASRAVGRAAGRPAAEAGDAAAVAPPAMDALPLVHHFPNADVVFARTSWRADATAFAFTCGPPEGHAAHALGAALPEWRQNMGHAHPDAGSFIIFARGRYLTGDAGYTGVKMTADHNTLLIDGQGQAHDGRHEVFARMEPAVLDAIRILRVERDAASGRLAITADGTAAYAGALGLLRWQRTLTFDGDRTFDVIDEVELARPARVSWLLHADCGLSSLAGHDGAPPGPDPSGGETFVIADGSPRLVIDARARPDLEARVTPHRVIAQGRPGSIERGARETRGQLLTLTTPLVTHADIRITLRVDATAPPHVSGAAAHARRAGAPR